MYTRWSKIILLFSVAFFATLVAFNNIFDYQSNFMFVSHVLSMDTTFADNNSMWRAIHSDTLAHFAFALIIAVELLLAVLCWCAGFKLYRVRRNVNQFNLSKGLAVAALTLGIIFWFIGFMVIGGEWFLMWQSHIWNGQEAAFRFTTILGIILVFLVMPDVDN
ncbi:MAG: DUF2165 domain-containing protein [Gammaproteobacteria bacterium]